MKWEERKRRERNFKFMKGHKMKKTLIEIIIKQTGARAMSLCIKGA